MLTVIKIATLTVFCSLSVTVHAFDFGKAARDLLDQSTPPANNEKPQQNSQQNAPVLGVGLEQTEISAGLKEALLNGTRYAVETLGREGGFDDPQAQIPLPQSLGLLESGLRKLGQGKLVDNFVATLNRAAEQAVPEAASVFANAVEEMSMEDALKILNGGENAATEYFQQTSTATLTRRFLPIVQKATADAGVTSAYKTLREQAQGVNLGMLGNLLGGDPTQIDLDQYVTEHALDSLFKLIAEQEQKIRSDSLARGSDLLRKIFQ